MRLAAAPDGTPESGTRGVVEATPQEPLAAATESERAGWPRVRDPAMLTSWQPPIPITNRAPTLTRIR